MQSGLSPRQQRTVETRGERKLILADILWSVLLEPESHVAAPHVGGGLDGWAGKRVVEHSISCFFCRLAITGAAADPGEGGRATGTVTATSFCRERAPTRSDRLFQLGWPEVDLSPGGVFLACQPGQTTSPSRAIGKWPCGLAAP